MAAVDADMANAEANRTKEALESWCGICQNTYFPVTSYQICFWSDFSSGWQHGREAWRSHFSQRLTQPRWPWMRSRRLSAAILTTWTLNPRFPFTCAIDCCWNEMEMLNLNRVITFKRKLGRLKIRGQAYFVTLCHLLPVLWSMTGSSLVFGWFPDSSAPPALVVGNWQSLRLRLGSVSGAPTTSTGAC